MNRFSEKEIEVLKLSIKGLQNKQISEKMFVTLHTVKAHMASIMRKLGVSNRTEVAYIVMKNHWFDNN